MARWFSTQPEIARRAHQAGAKVVLPDAVHHHARSERVVGVGDRLRQFEASAVVLECLPLRTGEHLQELARYFLAQARRPAPTEHARVRLRFALDEDERGRRAQFDQTAVHLALQLPEFFGDRRRKE